MEYKSLAPDNNAAPLARPLPHADCTEYLLRAAEGPVM